MLQQFLSVFNLFYRLFTLIAVVFRYCGTSSKCWRVFEYFLRKDAFPITTSFDKQIHGHLVVQSKPLVKLYNVQVCNYVHFLFATLHTFERKFYWNGDDGKNINSKTKYLLNRRKKKLALKFVGKISGSKIRFFFFLLIFEVQWMIARGVREREQKKI